MTDQPTGPQGQREPPNVIYLQLVDNPNDPFAWTWCADRINDEDVEYRRAPTQEEPMVPDGMSQSAMFHAARLGAMTRWLEEHHPEVFREGLWDAITAAEPTGVDHD